MKHYRLSTGKELFIGSQDDRFVLATYHPVRPNADDNKTLDPSQFRLDFPGGAFLVLTGKEADEMRDKLNA